MPFYSSLSFYRPGRPPNLTGADLASFVSAFATLDLADEEGTIDYRVKFGRAIDQDTRPAAWNEPVAQTRGIISVVRGIRCDAKGTDLPSLSHLSEELSSLDDPIYRAHLSLGYVTERLFAWMKRDPSEDNEESLGLDRWGLDVGPVMSNCLGGGPPIMVGWIAIEMHGYGDLYPWSFRDLIDRAEALAPIRGLMELCRHTWPVCPTKPPRRVVKARETMGELWPYPQVDRPMDWYWGLSENG